MALPTQTQANTTSTLPRASPLFCLLSRAAPLCLIMRNLCHSRRKFHYQLACLCSRSLCFLELFCLSALRLYRWVVRSLPRFWVMLLYFVFISVVGFVFLKLLAPGIPHVPSDLDLFFMAVSALTLSSMSTAEIGALSSGQLIVLAVLMLVGGEVFTSIVDLHIMEIKLAAEVSWVDSVNGGSPAKSSPSSRTDHANNQMELGSAAAPSSGVLLATGEEELKKYESLKTIRAVVFVYLVLAHAAGSMSILLYVIFNASSRGLLGVRGVSALGFSVFMAISSFANAGFVPLDDGMAPFKQSPGLLLLIIPLILAGNTLFPPLLRSAVWFSNMLHVVDGGRSEYILEDSRAIGFQHLLSSKHSTCLLCTVAGFICVQVVTFCWMEWGGAALDGLNTYQKVAGGLYMAVNSRHAGESPFDLSTVSPAVLVLFVVMMYLPPYTRLLPPMGQYSHDDEQGLELEHGGESLKSDRGKWSSKLVMKSLIMSQLSYLAIFVILVCITERRKLAEDPLNFNALNIVVEVISAYGNVGFSTGYSCARRLRRDGSCKDASYGFVGWWSGGGKLILIIVMFFGRLKKFNTAGGEAWKLG